MDFGAERLNERLKSDVTEQLRASLAKRAIAVCSGTVPTPPESGSEQLAKLNGPMATLVFLPLSKDGVSLSLEVHDSVTAKRVGRDVDLRNTPPDGRALVLALEADELLRATWAELALKDSPAPPRADVPPAVRRAVETSIASTTLARGAIGVRGAVERFTGYDNARGGGTFLGGDSRGEYGPHHAGASRCRSATAERQPSSPPWARYPSTYCT